MSNIKEIANTFFLTTYCETPAVLGGDSL